MTCILVFFEGALPHIQVCSFSLFATSLGLPLFRDRENSFSEGCGHGMQHDIFQHFRQLIDEQMERGFGKIGSRHVRTCQTPGTLDDFH